MDLLSISSEDSGSDPDVEFMGQTPAREPPHRLTDPDLLGQLRQEHEKVDAMHGNLCSDGWVQAEDVSDERLSEWFAPGIPLMMLKLMLVVRSTVVVRFKAVCCTVRFSTGVV